MIWRLLCLLVLSVGSTTAQTCARPSDLAGVGLVVTFPDGAVETYRLRGDGLVESRIEDSFGTATDRSRFGLFLVQGIEVNPEGQATRYSERYEGAGDLVPPEPGAQLKTRSTSFTEGEEEGSVSSIWRAGPETETAFGTCTHRAYLIDVQNTAMHPGATPEQQRYVYLPAFEIGILLDVRFQDEDWPPLEMPLIRRGP